MRRSIRGSGFTGGWAPGFLQVAPRSMVVTGTVAQWETWTTMRFPESGRYTVPGALMPVTIDRRRNRGRYVEPNVWMLHPIKAPGR